MPWSARCSASAGVNARIPRKPGPPDDSCASTRSSTSTQRSDFDATRTGSDPAWASRWSAFARSASRSTKANGASRPANAFS